MSAVLADLAIESEAATLLGLRLAHAVDSGEVALRRLATAVAKYYVCKRAPGHAAESLECLGGNGYVEDSGMPRLYRDRIGCPRGATDCAAGFRASSTAAQSTSPGAWRS